MVEAACATSTSSFKYQNIMTEDIVAFFNAQTGQESDADLRSVPAARGASGARADVRRDRRDGRVSVEGRRARLRDADSRRRARKWQIIQPTTTWQTMPTPLKRDAFEVATDLYS